MKQQLKAAIHMKKKLGGAESLGISKVGQTVLARLMESQIWHQLAGSLALWEEGLGKGQWPLLALVPGTSIPPFMLLVPLKLLLGAAAQRE